jgi:hypothetical protein
LLAHVAHLNHTVLSGSTSWRSAHVEQDVEHVHAANIGAHGCLVDLGAPLVEQRVEREGKPVLVVVCGTPAGGAVVGPLGPVGARIVVGIRVIVVRVIVVVGRIGAVGCERGEAWWRHDADAVRVWVVGFG